jgi:integrase
MASVYKENGKWTVSWFDSSRKRQYRRGLFSKQLAEQVGNANEFRKSAAKSGIITGSQEKLAMHGDIELFKHLQDFSAALLEKGDTVEHCDASVRAVERVFAAASIERIDAIDRDKVRSAVAKLKTALKGGKPLAIGTRNKYLAACKAFTAWLFDAGRIATDPLRRLPTRSTQTGLTRVRVGMTDAQIVTLFETTKLQKIRGGMTGIDRAYRYALGLGTGFRQGTLFSLKPENFDFASDPPIISVEAKNMKGRQSIEHPISDDLATLIKPWLASKEAGQPIFPKLPHAKPIKAWRADLKAVGITYNEPGTILFCDQHSQRNTFITAIIRASGLAVAQQLAHHSTPTLTAKYARLGMDDYAKALASLPKLGKQEKRKRGTA